MFGDFLVWDSTSEQNAKNIYKKLDKKLLLRKSIISIGGISGTRKSETAFKLAEKFIESGKQCHIISGDDYYKIPWHTRNDERKKDIEIVGPDELDWQRLHWTIETFRNPLYNNIHCFLMSKFTTDVIECYLSKNKCDILIFEGLYGCDSRIDADVKVNLGDCNPESTFKFRKKRNKENEENSLRKEIVRRECQAVKTLMQYADIIV